MQCQHEQMPLSCRRSHADSCTSCNPQEYVASFRPLLLDECAALLLRGGGMADQPPPQAVVTSGTEQVAGSSSSRCVAACKARDGWSVTAPEQNNLSAHHSCRRSRALGTSHCPRKPVHCVLPQDGDFTQVHLTMNLNAPSDFSDNDCVLLSSRHPEVGTLGRRLHHLTTVTQPCHPASGHITAAGCRNCNMTQTQQPQGWHRARC